MFMTFKNSSHSTSTLKQVSQRSAKSSPRPQQDAVTRTPPCSACQVQKLRCTGDASTCDRCSAKSIVCITSRTQNGARQTNRRSASPPAASPQPRDRQRDRQDTQTPSSQASIENSTLSSHSTRQTSEANSETPPPCSCLEDMASVVQKLDDDEFHLTTLALDGVLQVQKWLIFQCCRPLECPRCSSSSSVHTLLIIVCDRLTKMFDCTSRRLKRIRVTTTGGMSMEALSDVLRRQTPADAPPEPLGQLFCSVTGSPADQSECNPLVFSGDLQGRYTEEEQVHMIRGIINLHVGYFRKLLSRVEVLSQEGGNKARLSRILAIIAKLDVAATAIDQAFQGILMGERIDQ